jgi:hypothetical protein
MSTLARPPSHSQIENLILPLRPRGPGTNKASKGESSHRNRIEYNTIVQRQRPVDGIHAVIPNEATTGQKHAFPDCLRQPFEDSHGSG